MGFPKRPREGAQLRREREAVGMPPGVLADAIGLGRSVVCNWERDLNPIPGTRWPAIREAIASYAPPNPEDRFWEKVDKCGPIPKHMPHLGRCWVWTAGKSGGGYGSACRDGGHVPAHRLAWELAHGSISDGRWVLHHCDNKVCVNSTHLFLGDPKVNVADMVVKERADFWAHRSTGRRKLTAADVVEVRRLYRDTRATQTELGIAFDVSQTLVSGIVSRRFWDHVV